jgi:hypothetical protein
MISFRDYTHSKRLPFGESPKWLWRYVAGNNVLPSFGLYSHRVYSLSDISLISSAFYGVFGPRLARSNRRPSRRPYWRDYFPIDNWKIYLVKLKTDNRVPIVNSFKPWVINLEVSRVH